MRDKYHFVITLQMRTSRGDVYARTASGTLAAGPDDTRQSLYDMAFQRALAGGGDAAVLFFSLERNQL
ncbi:hypothetical protein ACFQ7J_02180 [Streptomyces sp. NPDC056501]|uniref:hypothetical protein n=1 Tax=Streptomyces sp. NPDC056501 TaxID=3345841 RepID=UPI0036830E5C